MGEGLNKQITAPPTIFQAKVGMIHSKTLFANC